LKGETHSFLLTVSEEAKDEETEGRKTKALRPQCCSEQCAFASRETRKALRCCIFFALNAGRVRFFFPLPAGLARYHPAGSIGATVRSKSTRFQRVAWVTDVDLIHSPCLLRRLA